MTKLKLFFAAFVTVAIVAIVPLANAAPVVHFLGAGSSAMYTGFEVAAVNDLAKNTAAVKGGGSIHHFTIKGGCAGGTCAQLHDLRSVSIPLEAATFWVVYTCTSAACSGSDAQDVWAYLQVDSTVGVRSFMSRPAGCASPCNLTAVQSLVDAGVKTTNAGLNLVNPALLQFGETGVPVSSCPSSGAGSTTCDDQFVPSDVWVAVSGTTGVTLTAGLTDIRPEDAKYATHRLNAPLNTTTWDGLGYSTSATAPVGATIKSGVDGGKTGATPVDFGLPGGKDPITGVGVPSTITTIPIGESPIVFIVNRTNGIDTGSGFSPGLGWGIVAATPSSSTPYYTNALDYAPASGIPTAYPLAKLFKGKSCEGLAQIWGPDGNNFPPAGGALMNLTKAIHPGVGGASTTDYVFSSLQGAALSVGQRVVIALFSNAGNNGVFTISAINVNGNTSKFEVSNSGGVTQTTTGPVAATNDFPIHVFIREGLSGTMNTAEYTEFRSYGEVLGSDSSPKPATPSNSQEQNIIVNNGTGDNPLAQKQCLGGFFAHGSTGDKTRAIGTGQEVSAVKGQPDSIGYTFFSFGNVAPLALASASNTGGTTTPYKYGYLTVDGVDPIFQSYSGGDPGQPAGSTTILGSPGQLPACDFFGATVNPACQMNAIWGSEGSFPHLRDGTYRAWSLLRGMCDPANIVSGQEHCLTTANDPTNGDDFGLQGLIQSARSDIDNNTGVPDFLPYQDITFYRSHFQAGAEFGMGIGPSGSNTPEAGGDVGGCILPVPQTNSTVPSGPFSGMSALNCHQ